MKDELNEICIDCPYKCKQLKIAHLVTCKRIKENPKLKEKQ